MGATSFDGPVETWGDYGRACAVDGYIGPVGISDREGLVLGDEPAMTPHLRAERLFLRWAAAYDEEDLLTAARRVVPSPYRSPDRRGVHQHPAHPWQRLRVHSASP